MSNADGPFPTLPSDPPGLRDSLERVALWCLTCGILIFLLLATAVHWGRTRSLDESILKSVRKLSLRNDPVLHVWAEESIIAITSLGTPLVLIGASCTVLGLLLFTGQRSASMFLVVSLLGAIGLNYGLKALFDRARPTVVPRIQPVDSPSFPSGHALISTAVYTALSLIAANRLRRPFLKVYILVIAAFVALCVGLSRVYLGVHYPSDVLAGWALGLAWTGASGLITRALQSYGFLEAAQ